MTGILTELSHWATTLPFWEQAALEKIINGVNFTEADINELLQYLLEDGNLATPQGKRPILHFPKDDKDDSQPITPLRLIQISNLQNVNALVSGQILPFCPLLTAIFGANGSGKSGYARVLGCAGFTRGDREVLPDVARPIDEDTVLSADIRVTDGVSIHDINYSVSERCPDLTSFYVFDSTSVRVHLTQSNTLSFSPAGLSHLTRLAEITDIVRDQLRKKVEACSQPHSFGNLFQGDSDVRKLISVLGPTTDLNAIRKLAHLTKEEENQIKTLDIQTAQLKSQDVPAQITVLKKKITDLEILVSKLKSAKQSIDDTTAKDIQKIIDTYHKHRTDAQLVSVDQFKSKHFTQTGGDVWYEFIRAARILAAVEQPPPEQYPKEDSRCLLCQQPLSPEARDLLLRLWAFLESDAQAKLIEVQELLVSKSETLETINVDFFDDQSVSYRHLQEHDASTLDSVKTLLANFRQRRDGLVNAINTKSTKLNLPQFPKDPIPAIEKTIKTLNSYCTDLQMKDPSADVARLEQQLRSLQHRVILRQYLPAIESYVQQVTWAQKASKAGGTTRHITNKYNELFKTLVTDRYIQLFEQMLTDLGRPLRIKVATRAYKAETYKQIVVEADPSIPVDKGTLDKVLSEGEKRAVALADFLTEVALDTTSSGIILDDPVTSLDLEWRNLIASILVKEAKRRQVIVFTHDLPFLYFLKKYAEQESVQTATHWIKRGDVDDKPGYVFRDNSPALERSYRKPTRAHELYEKAKAAPAAEQEALLREGFGALRTTYEAFIIFELFQEVVMRFDERISPGRLTDIVWDASIAKDVKDKHEALSRFIEGHLHSDALGKQKLTPALLMSEIDAFEGLSKKLKALKKKP